MVFPTLSFFPGLLKLSMNAAPSVKGHCKIQKGNTPKLQNALCRLFK
jgi:hypothetical protein